MMQVRFFLVYSLGVLGGYLCPLANFNGTTNWTYGLSCIGAGVLAACIARST